MIYLEITYFDLVRRLNLILILTLILCNEKHSLYIKEITEAVKKYSTISIAYQKFTCAFAIPPITCNNPGPETHNTTAGFPIEERSREDVLRKFMFIFYLIHRFRNCFINLSLITFNSTGNLKGMKNVFFFFPFFFSLGYKNRTRSCRDNNDIKIYVSILCIQNTEY